MRALPIILATGNDDIVLDKLEDNTSCSWIRPSGSDFDAIDLADGTIFRDLKDSVFSAVKFLSSSACVDNGKTFIKGQTDLSAFVVSDVSYSGKLSVHSEITYK